MSARVTEAEVREMVGSRVEPAEGPDGVLEVFKRENGKQLTKRILPIRRAPG
jgi:hypothetical protein